MRSDDPLMLVSDRDWLPYEGLPFVVHAMLPGVRGARAAIEIESPNSGFRGTAMIFHAKDFSNLTEALTLKGKDSNKVVAIEWSKNHINGILRLFAPFLPRLNIQLFTKESFELLLDSSLQPDLNGVARFLAEKPLATWEAG